MAIGLAFLTLAGIALLVIGWMGWKGSLPRNGWAGIRTPFTMQSDENWQAAHHYGAPVLIFGGVAVVAGGLALLPFALAGALPDGFLLAVTLGMSAVLFVSAIGSWLVGVNRAKQELGGS